MPAGYYRAVVTIPHNSGLPQDAAVNVWSFQNENTAAVASVDAPLIQTRLDNFYTALISLFSSQMNWAGTTLKVYNYVDSQPRVPILEATMAISGEITTSNDLPPEVAMCLSFKGQPVSGTNARRRRGRVYLGPLASAGSAEIHEVLASWISVVMTAADNSLAVVGDQIQWAVYSPYTHHGVPVGRNINETEPGTDTPLFPENSSLLTQAFVPVHSYWMDNAWDTQRRRGTKATSRTSALAGA
jgi:hypothetical protein